MVWYIQTDNKSLNDVAIIYFDEEIAKHSFQIRCTNDTCQQLNHHRELIEIESQLVRSYLPRHAIHHSKYDVYMPILFLHLDEAESIVNENASICHIKEITTKNYDEFTQHVCRLMDFFDMDGQKDVDQLYI